jgi:hypothetical protein
MGGAWVKILTHHIYERHILLQLVNFKAFEEPLSGTLAAT